MRRKAVFPIVLGVILAVLALAVIAVGADNNVGSWKMNPAQSKYSPGPAPKSQSVKIEAWGADGVKYASDGIGADGKPTHMEFSAKYDGKDYPFTGNPDADTIVYKRVDDHTLEATLKKEGKVTQNVRIVVSRDGKTRTLTQTGKDAQGRDVRNTVVFDRQ